MDSTTPRQPSYSGADGAVGTVFIIFGALGMIGSLLLSYLVQAFVGSLTGGPRMTLSPNGFATEQPPSLLQFLPQIAVFLVFATFALLTAAGWGIRLSRSWAFSLGIVLCGLMLPAGSGWAVFGVVGFVFCAFRRIF